MYIVYGHHYYPFTDSSTTSTTASHDTHICRYYIYRVWSLLLSLLVLLLIVIAPTTVSTMTIAFLNIYTVDGKSLRVALKAKKEKKGSSFVWEIDSRRLY